MNRDSEQPDADGPSSVSTFEDEDFLFHLYRGSELLQDSCVTEAKEELERALSMRPRDVESQGLLGVVYFRLGLYPRAIQIYEQLIRDVPREVTPRVNLALCFLKTGQLAQARETLEQVIRLVPDHVRAWGYLGLVFERLGDYAKAQASFERAGQSQMARRMQNVIDDQLDRRARDSARPEQHEIREAAALAAEQLEHNRHAFSAAPAPTPEPRGAGRWIEPGQAVPPPIAPMPAPASAGRFGPAVPPVLPSLPASAPAPAVLPATSELVAGCLLEFPGVRGAVRLSARLAAVHAEAGYVVRVSALRGASSPSALTHTPAQRKARGRALNEPLGGAAEPFVQLHGRVDLVLGVAQGELFVLTLGREFLFVREPRLVGFDAELNAESGRLPSDWGDRPPLVQLSGQGTVVFDVTCGLRTLPVAGGASVLVPGADVVGWTGRLLPRAVPPSEAPGSVHGLVSFSGDGAIFVDIA